MKCSKEATVAALHLEGLPDEETVFGCFEFHHRTRSFDLPHSPSKHKLNLLAHLLRSRSDGSVRSSQSSSTTTAGHSPKASPRASPRASPHASPGPPTRRRFVRVVRDSKDADMENPHVIHKYSSEFLSNLQKSMSVEEHQNCPPPYTVTGHTILKKQPLGSGTGSGWTTSVDSAAPESSPTIFPKHASFLDEVEIMEYDRKEKIRRGLLAMRKVRLHDSPVGSAEEDDSEGVVDSSLEPGETDRCRKSVTHSDSLQSTASLDVPSENSEFSHIFTPITPPSESKSSGLSERSGEGAVCPLDTAPILTDKPNDAESHRESTSQDDVVSEPRQRLSIYILSSSLDHHPTNTGPT